MKFKLLLLLILILPASSFAQYCLGPWDFMYIGSHMPYVTVKCGTTQGRFIVDYATDTTAIDIYGMTGGIPQPNTGSANTFTLNFDGYNYTQFLSKQDFSGVSADGIRQGGILGTDILAQHIYTLDFADKHIDIVNKPETFCGDTLYSYGYIPVTTAGYFGNDRSKLIDPKTNVPTVPIKIGGVAAVAQLDPGFDDRYAYHSININRAFFDLIKKNGIDIYEIQATKKSNLSTCKVGYNDTIVECRINGNAAFEITGINHERILVTNKYKILMKHSPKEAKSCGGIGTWDHPGAQIGASFLLETDAIVFDPFDSKVYIKLPVNATGGQ